MSRSVSIAEAIADFESLIARVEAGEEINICRDGDTVAVLKPPPAPPKQRKQKIIMGDLAHLLISDDLGL